MCMNRSVMGLMCAGSKKDECSWVVNSNRFFTQDLKE